MASPNISFQTIPNGIRKPGTYIEENTSNAIQGLAPAGNKVCILAQRIKNLGVQASNVPVKVFSDADASTYFGYGSVAHLAAQAALTANPNIDLSVMGLDDNGTTKAVGYIYVSQTAGAGGSITAYVGDKLASCSINTNDVGVTGAYNLSVALNNIKGQLPVDVVASGAGATGIVTLTARNAGTVGNQIALGTVVTGCTGMAVSVVEPTGGASDPVLGPYTDITKPLSQIVGSGYNIIQTTLLDSTNLGYVNTFVNFVTNSVEQNSTVAVAGVTDQVATVAATEALAAGLNSGRFALGYVSYATGNQLKAEAYRVGATYAAEIAAEPDVAVPLDNAVLVGMPAPSVVDRFSRSQQEDMLNNGVTPLIVIPGEELAICRSITTYTQNASGITDPTLLDLQTIRTLDYVRDSVRTKLVQVFSGKKLSTKTPSAVKTEVMGVLYNLESLEIVQNVKVYEAGVIVEKDLQNIGQLNIKIPTNIVTGLHVLAGRLDLII